MRGERRSWEKKKEEEGGKRLLLVLTLLEAGAAVVDDFEPIGIDEWKRAKSRVTIA